MYAVSISIWLNKQSGYGEIFRSVVYFHFFEAIEMKVLYNNPKKKSTRHTEKASNLHQIAPCYTPKCVVQISIAAF